MKLFIQPDGSVTCIYSDQLVPLLDELGVCDVVRASHVEPTGDGRWQADLRPVKGPLLPPTRTRQQSLDREVQWLEEHACRSVLAEVDAERREIRHPLRPREDAMPWSGRASEDQSSNPPY
jgi:hypothetical protein